MPATIRNLKRRLIATVSAIALAHLQAATAIAGPTGPTVDPTVPAAGAPMSSSVLRNNFQATYNDLNNLITGYVGPTPPDSPKVYMLWIDNSVNPVVLKRWDGAQWISTGALDTAGHYYNPFGVDRVYNNAALRSLVPPAYPNASVLRLGFYAQGDAPALLFNWQPAGCGTPDNLGMCVQPSAGGTGAWQASYDPSGGVDSREFGAKVDGVTDDTTAISNAITAICAMNPKLPLLLAKQVAVNGTLASSCAGLKIIAAPGAGFVGTAGIGLNPLFTYTGVGPFEVDGVHFTCPIYDPITSASPNCNRMLYIDNATGQTTGVVIRNSTFTGGAQGVLIENTTGLRLQNNTFDRTSSIGYNIDASAGLLTTSNYNYLVTGNVCLMTGHYCGTFFANSTPVVNNNPSVADIEGNVCIGAGAITGSDCWDITSKNNGVFKFDNIAIDSLGGAEFKRTQPTQPSGISTTTVPYGTLGQFIRLQVNTHLDTSVCGLFPSEAGADVVRFPRRSTFADIYCTYIDPPPWVASSSVAEGEIRAANGQVYQAWNSGKTGTIAPGGTSNQLDGTVYWRYKQSLPINQGARVAVPLGGITGGSGFAPGDELLVTGGSCSQSPVFSVGDIDSNAAGAGQIIKFNQVFEGLCTAPPPNPATLTKITGAGVGTIMANIDWHYVASSLTGASLEGSSNMEIHVHGYDIATGVDVAPRGDNQMISDDTIYIDGVYGNYCMTDDLPNEAGSQNGYVNNLTLVPHCTAQGHQNGAINLLPSAAVNPWSQYGCGGPVTAGHVSTYGQPLCTTYDSSDNPVITVYFQNDIVSNAGNRYMAVCAKAQGCVPGTAGPTATGNTVSDGSTDGLTWNQTSFANTQLTYSNFRIEGGYLENRGWHKQASSVIAQKTTIGSISGEIVNTQLRGATSALYITAPVTLTITGSTLAVTRQDPSILWSPIVLSGTSATGTITLLNGVNVTGASTQQGVQLVTGATGIVKGRLFRGILASNPTATRPCSPQDFYGIDIPTTSIKEGWPCTTPSTTAAGSVFSGY